MSNKSVIAIFVIGVASLLLAFWAGLNVTKEPAGMAVSRADTKAAGATDNTGIAGQNRANSGESSQSRFLVLVGTFGTVEKADQLTSELRKKSYRSAYTQTPSRGGDDQLYRVFIGPYEKPEADKVASELAAEGRKGVMIKPQN